MAEVVAGDDARELRLSGFTFLRDGVALGYPFLASIRSVLPIVDEFVVALGECRDGTREALESLGEPKLRIVPTQWNESMRDRGFVYGQQKMIAHYCCSGDWAFYLEGDEVLHEDELVAIRAAVEAADPDPRVEALALRYHHFFGSAAWRAVGPGWYRTAVRIIRNTVRAYSPDGLFFTVSDAGNKRMRYPRAAVLAQHVYHYGHVRTVEHMRAKTRAVGKYWNKVQDFDRYAIDPRMLAPWTGSHPAVIASWLDEQAQTGYVPDRSHVPSRRERRQWLKMRVEQILGLDLSRKHYRAVALPAKAGRA